jgi:hypothetical protein
MIDPKYLHIKRIAITFKRQGQEQTYFVDGRPAQALAWLVHCGACGVTALEMSSWALRLADYVFVLRHRYGLDIYTQLEPHHGGRHARYILREAIIIVSIIPTEAN